MLGLLYHSDDGVQHQEAGGSLLSSYSNLDLAGGFTIAHTQLEMSYSGPLDLDHTAGNTRYSRRKDGIVLTLCILSHSGRHVLILQAVSSLRYSATRAS